MYRSIGSTGCSSQTSVRVSFRIQCVLTSFWGHPECRACRRCAGSPERDLDSTQPDASHWLLGKNCHRNVDVARTDATYWPSGRLHAILGGSTAAFRTRLFAACADSLPASLTAPTTPMGSDGAAEDAAGDRRFRMVHSLQAATCHYSRLPLYVYVGARRASGPNNAWDWNQ